MLELNSGIANIISGGPPAMGMTRGEKERRGLIRGLTPRAMATAKGLKKALA
jgi:hypothetical protein